MSVIVDFKVENFQSIKKAELEFKGFTVITGKSNLGKSAVRRAFSSLLYNNWNNGYVRVGEKETKIQFNRGSLHIEQLKGSKNTYIVNGVEYTKVGVDVPDEFTKLGWKPLETDNNKYPLQTTTQNEGLFMVTYSDVENTKIINSALKVALYEEAAKLANKDLNRSKTSNKERKEKKESKERELRQVKEKQEKVEKLREIEKKTRKIEQYKENRRQEDIEQKKKDNLEKLVNATIMLSDLLRFKEMLQKQVTYDKERKLAIKINNRIIKLEALLEHMQGVGATLKAKQNQKRYTTLLTTITSLGTVITTTRVVRLLTTTKRRVKELTTINNNIDKIDSINTYININNEKNSRIQDENNIKRVLENRDKIQAIENYTHTLTQQNQLLEEQLEEKTKLDEIVGELSKVKVCPLCGSTTTGGLACHTHA